MGRLNRGGRILEHHRLPALGCCGANQSERPLAFTPGSYSAEIMRQCVTALKVSELRQTERSTRGRLQPLMADAGYSVRRVRRHFADVQDLILTGRSWASSSEIRPSEVGHFRSYERSSDRDLDDRFPNTAAIARRPLERDHSPLRSLTVLLSLSTSDARGTSAIRSAELALPTRCCPSYSRWNFPEAVISPLPSTHRRGGPNKTSAISGAPNLTFARSLIDFESSARDST